jgi:hypothetical protein
VRSFPDSAASALQLVTGRQRRALTLPVT